MVTTSWSARRYWKPLSPLGYPWLFLKNLRQFGPRLAVYNIYKYTNIFIWTRSFTILQGCIFFISKMWVFNGFGGKKWRKKEKEGREGEKRIGKGKGKREEGRGKGKGGNSKTVSDMLSKNLRGDRTLKLTFLGH